MTQPVGFTDEPTTSEPLGLLELAVWVTLTCLLIRYNPEVGQWLAALLIGE